MSEVSDYWKPALAKAEAVARVLGLALDEARADADRRVAEAERAMKAKCAAIAHTQRHRADAVYERAVSGNRKGDAALWLGWERAASGIVEGIEAITLSSSESTEPQEAEHGNA